MRHTLHKKFWILILILFSSPAFSSEDDNNYSSKKEQLRKHSPGIDNNHSSKKKESENCSVCLSQLTSSSCSANIKKLECGHVYHQACIDKWFSERKYTCPLCRATNKIALYNQIAGVIQGLLDDGSFDDFVDINERW